MRFFVPIPIPAMLLGGVLFLHVRALLWVLRILSRVTVQVVRYSIREFRRSMTMIREAHEQRRAADRERRQHKERVAEFVRRVDAVERQVHDYCAERAAGRVIDGECRRLPEHIA